MKDTPAGVGGSEGIAAPPGPGTVVVTSIMAKPAWAAMEDMAMGIPCCMTAEPGGEEPPGGKKTWLMAPEGMQGLAFAIQRARCRLYRGRTFTKTCQGVVPSADTHFEPRVPGSSFSCVRPHPPCQWGRRKVLSAECVLLLLLLLFPPVRRATTSSSSSPRSADSSYCRGVTSMNGVSLRLVKSPGVCAYSLCVCAKQRRGEGKRG